MRTDVLMTWDALQEDQVKRLREELAKVSSVAENAKNSWDKFKSERDIHRMHHRRVVQEKNKLVTDMKRLKYVCSALPCSRSNLFR